MRTPDAVPRASECPSTTDVTCARTYRRVSRLSLRPQTQGRSYHTPAMKTETAGSAPRAPRHLYRKIPTEQNRQKKALFLKSYTTPKHATAVWTDSTHDSAHEHGTAGRERSRAVEQSALSTVQQH